MNELIEKISSYNLFNYLIPGSVFAFLAERLDLIVGPSEILERLIWYYFIGLLISRVGSIIIEPILKILSFIKYSEYEKYLKADSIDPKISIIFEVTNTYRTLCTAFIILPISHIISTSLSYYGVSYNFKNYALIAGIAILFVFSYRKQNNYLIRRIEHSGG